MTNIKEEYREGGRVNMWKALEDLIADGKEEGISIGRNERTKELIQKKLAKGKSIPTIADELEETEEEIQRLMEAM